MGLTFSTFQKNINNSSSTNTVTVTIPLGSAVGVVVSIGDNDFAIGYHAGTITDSGGNTYLSGGGGHGSAGTLPNIYCDSLYCLNTGSSATSLTYTASASYTLMSLLGVFVWVWTPSGGSATFGSESFNVQSAPGTGTDAITSGSVTCATGSVIMGVQNTSTGTSSGTPGTGFTQDYNGFGLYGLRAEHGAFSASQAATWTSTDGTETTMSNAISFGLTYSATIAWVT